LFDVDRLLRAIDVTQDAELLSTTTMVEHRRGNGTTRKHKLHELLKFYETGLICVENSPPGPHFCDFDDVVETHGETFLFRPTPFTPRRSTALETRNELAVLQLCLCLCSSSMSSLNPVG
jgi:hypothetical protein